MRRPIMSRSLLAASLLLAATACASDPVGPASAEPSAARASAGGPVTQWTIEDFVAAQGTYCGSVGQFCHPTEDIASIVIWSGPTGVPVASIDFGGVNVAWYEANLGGDFDYAASGTVRERRLADGSRLVTVNLRFENTLFAAAGADGMLLGALFEEYGTVEPVTASGSVMLQFILPADYEGLPDFVQLALEPAPGMELLQVVANVQGEGTLRMDYDGMAAGTPVRVTLHAAYLPKLGDTPAANATGLARTFLGPSDAVRIQPIGG
jgi:hypothetical protein